MLAGGKNGAKDGDADEKKLMIRIMSQ